MADQLAFLPERVFTAAAMPGAGYRAQFFQSGTTTPVTVYTTAALSLAHPSPLASDANGVFPAVFSAGGAIKAVITKPDGSSFYTLDPVFRVATSGAGASEITFAPTPELPFTNVQDAVEAAAASAATGFTPFGLGVTGTNALIANIDATNTASGAYRFDNTTTGTFPTGVTATNTGTVQIERENAGDAVMFLQSGAADRAFFRRMAGSTWGAWQEVITVPQGSTEGDIIYRGASAWLRLAKGTANQVLTMNSGATAPEWGAQSRVLLASKTASASATLDFTEFNNALYSRYVFEIDDILPATNAVSFRCRFSTNGGSSYDTGGTDYIFIAEDYTGAGSAAGDGNSGQSYIEVTRLNSANSAAGVGGICGDAHVVNAGNASARTKIYGTGGFYLSGGSIAVLRFYGQRTTAQDTDAVRFFFSSGNIASGRIRLYGVA